MSASLEAIKKFINMDSLKDLKEALDLCILKKAGNKRSASIVFSSSGNKYKSGILESDTHLLDIQPEQIALMLSVHNNDFGVNKIITMLESPNINVIVSPITAKIIIDHSVRTGKKIEYTVIDFDGEILFEIDDIRKIFDFYKPSDNILDKATDVLNLESNKAQILKGEDVKEVLKRFALKGVVKNFPTSNSASGYGSAVLTEGNDLYFGGQYSSFEKRTGLHSEMAVVAGALMDGNSKITHIGLVSSKYADEPCNMCGFCRQFLSEMINKFNLEVEIYLFAKNNDNYKQYSIREYLPGQWSSKNWEK